MQALTVVTTVKKLLSWDTALFEYIPLTIANRLADENGINLLNVRAPSEAIDLIWSGAFMYKVRGDKLRPQHAVGMALATGGVAMATLWH